MGQRRCYLLLLVTTMAALCTDTAQAIICRNTFSGHDSFGCKTGQKCINFRNICDGGYNCIDGSDEDTDLCGFWRRGINFNSAKMHCARGTSDYDPRFCQIISAGKLMDLSPPTPPPAPPTTPPAPGNYISSEELMLNLSMAVNSTLTKTSLQHHDCPMLYTKIGDKCFALFSLAKVPWAEARQFCLSVYGDLAYFDNAASYAVLLDHMKDAKLTSNYWLGGRYDLDTNVWSWVKDDSPMPLGSPYWSLGYKSACVRRPPPHTDPFSDPPEVLPGAPCYRYTQEPSHRAQGWCSVMTYERFYYISEDQCQEAHSPLCVLTASP